MQFSTLRPRGLPSRSDETYATLLADIDGDGDLDAIVGNVFDYNAERLYLNDGSGRFDPSPFPLPASPWDGTQALAAADVDRDGDLDLVLGNVRQDRLYLNDGRGRFANATSTHMPLESGATTALVLGDVDGDLDLDLVIAIDGSQSLLLRNDGSGRFSNDTLGRVPAAAHATKALALGDIDGDSDLDLVLGNHGQDLLYRNDGSGRFFDVTAAQLPADTDATNSIELGDVDRDGDLDLLVCNSGQERLALNNGTGFFTDVTATHLPVDSGDDLDLALGDLDGDGDADLVIGHLLYTGNEPNRLYANDGTGRFADVSVGRMPATAGHTRAIAIGDVDADGDLDLALGTAHQGEGQQNHLFLNDGRGRFLDANAPRWADGYFANAIAARDFDGDGRLDLAVATSSDSGHRLFLGDGVGGFTDVTTTHLQLRLPGAGTVGSADLDGDGDFDLVFGYVYPPLGGIPNVQTEQRLFLNDGTGRFRDATATHLPLVIEDCTSVALADIDGDGDPDLALGAKPLPASPPRRNRLFRNDGQGRFAEISATHLPVDTDRTNAIVFTDVDRDGDADLITGNEGQSRLNLNDGTGVFTDVTAARLPAISANTTSVALADVELDGDLDLFLGGNWAQQCFLYKNNGAGFFAIDTASGFPAISTTTFGAAFADVDEDGFPDLATCGGQGSESLFLNDTTGRFVDVSSTRLPTSDRVYALSVTAADVDRDGDADLLYASGRPKVLLNLLRQVSSPFTPSLRRPFRLDFYARYGPSRQADFALPILGAVTTQIPLPSLGVLGLDPAFAFALPPISIPQPAGVASLELQVPHQRELFGIWVYAQALIMQLPTQSRLTNVEGDIIWR
ncbi:MAG: VCBS repeat-containing protein [Planctomycetes bacterium]|nr:VCBS repeat-containing protein [Planctomycetota bacterium]